MPKIKRFRQRNGAKRGFLDLPFSWVFALIVGAIILFGAIYFATRASNVANTESSAQTGSSLLNLLSPLQNGVESANSITINLPVNSIINHQCSTFGNFGTDSISVDQFVNNKWTDTGVKISSENKYIFFPSSLQGKNLNVFSEPFSFPFKVADLMYVTNADTKYCFLNMPTTSRKGLQNLNQGNFEYDNCSNDSVKVCFNSNINCNVNVDTNYRTVTKNGNTVYFQGDALMYAAIFSDQKIYECELGRLMNRTKTLLDIYKEKSANLLKVGCDSSTDFAGFQSDLESFNGSADLYILSNDANNMNSINSNSGCTLW
jgi:hypothetical protein